MTEHVRRLLLLDTASLYFRAFFGVPDSITAPDGTPVNAVRGLLDFIARLVTDREPDRLVCCWDDDWRPAWRVDLLPSYKAHRVVEEQAGLPDLEETPDPLSAQVPVIVEALELLGVPVVGAAEHEADDVIGTLATVWTGPVDVVTGDRDLFQLVDDEASVRILYTARGVGRHEVVDAAWVRTKYGVEPQQYADFAVLRGDPSDGLPGVSGIGDKTAQRLLSAHGDLNGILRAAARSEGPAAKQAQRLAAAGDYLAVAPRVVRVVRDLVLGDVDGRIGAWDDAAASRFEDFSRTWGLGSSAERVTAALAPLRTP
jgi:5'-3' exonuclease